MEGRLNVRAVRDQFPIFHQSIDGYPRVQGQGPHAARLVYLDSAASAQKPRVVIETMHRFMESDYANVKRGMHVLAERATEAYEGAREVVRQFLNAKRREEIIFTRNTTEAINLVTRSWGEANLKRGDTVLLTLLEHHSNIVPWLQLKEKLGIRLEWVGLNPDGTLDMSDLKRKLTTCNVQLATLTCVSNVLGVVTPFKEIVQLAHEHGALCLLDAAQLAPHAPIDVQAIGCDFLAFSGHKVYGPTGIGVFYGRYNLLDAMPPFLGGGTMIREVKTSGFTPASLPEKFEAGTPAIVEAVGLRAALEWLNGLGWENIQAHERDLLSYTLEKLKGLPFVEVLGPKDASKIASCISFVVSHRRERATSNEQRATTIHPHDLTEVLGRKGVCLRAGHHCAMPLHTFLGVPATSRMSVAVYNTREDVDRMCEGIEEAYSFFMGQ